MILLSLLWQLKRQQGRTSQNCRDTARERSAGELVALRFGALRQDMRRFAVLRGCCSEMGSRTHMPLYAVSHE